jgi:hypothetical protein
MGELRLFQRRKRLMCGPTTLSGTLLRSGSGRPNSSRSSANPRRLLPDQLYRTALFSSAYSDGSYGNASRGELILAPLGPSRPLQPRALVLILGWTRNASRGAARQNSHLSSRGIFAIGPPTSEAVTITGSASHSPGVV